MSIKHKALPWLNPETNKPESDEEYLVLTEDECFFAAFWNPLGFKGWMDVSNNRELNVLLYQELPNASELLKQLAKSAA